MKSFGGSTWVWDSSAGGCKEGLQRASAFSFDLILGIPRSCVFFTSEFLATCLETFGRGAHIHHSGDVPFTFWGLHRYRILRLCHLEKRLNYPQRSPYLPPHTHRKLLRSTSKLQCSGRSTAPAPTRSRTTWPAPSKQARTWCQSRAPSGRFSAIAASTCQTQRPLPHAHRACPCHTHSQVCPSLLLF